MSTSYGAYSPEYTKYKEQIAEIDAEIKVLQEKQQELYSSITCLKQMKNVYSS